jgi:Succinate dehydrogenase/fumarate reductase, flavoprotein subunit
MLANTTGIQDIGKIEWPYSVNYGKENYSEVDVLVLGGGLSGCAAAINAAKRGAKVAIVDKGPIVRSGSGGTGIDHWHDACTAPFSKVTPEKMVEWYLSTPYWGGKFTMAHQRYIQATESYDALLDLEKMGCPIRDMDDEFEGAAFRDEKTRLMVAYDYKQGTCIRLKGGALMKPLMKAEVARLGIEMYDYVMSTSLLTKDGKTGPGATVIGGTGFSVRTGEFYVWKAKSVIVCTGIPQGLWRFSTELNGSSSNHWDPNLTGDGHVMLAKAGAELTLMESNNNWGGNGGFRYPMYGVGDWSNTWYPCPIVDANGKKIPYMRDGKEIESWEEHFDNAWPGFPKSKENITPGGLATLPPDLPERIKKGEFELPFYADLTALTPHERRALWGLMIGNEGKTNYPVYKLYGANGFDPEKDMLQLPIFSPDDALTKPSWVGTRIPQWREAHRTSNCAIFDWNLKSTLDGLYVAGLMTANNYGAGAHATGRYAGRNAWKHAQEIEFSELDQAQIEAEKERVYASVKRTDGMGWKEFRAGCARVMQDHCSAYKTEKLLKEGLTWFKSIKEQEMPQLWARNPHELMRVNESYSQVGCSELTLHASLSRKASTMFSDFKRTDYPEVDPPEYDKFITVTMDENGEYVTGSKPLNYYLLPPYAPTYKENYDKNCCLKD